MSHKTLNKSDWTDKSYQTGQALLRYRLEEQRKAQGQYLTPPTVAHYMAEQLGVLKAGGSVLDPAVGAGTLLCAVVDRLIAEGQSTEIWLDGFELDAALAETAITILKQAADQALQYGIHVHTCIFQGDFVLAGLDMLQPSLFNDAPTEQVRRDYDHVIANPPYFKVRSGDKRVERGRALVPGHTNIYTLFMSLCSRLLAPGGIACFIVPRSFCSGAYFAALRRDFLTETKLHHIHLFESREDTFNEDDVLQENVVLTFSHALTTSPVETILLSASQGVSDLTASARRPVAIRYIVRDQGKAIFFRLPVKAQDELGLDIVDGWLGTLHQYGLEVSTGPVVPFRAHPFLLEADEPDAVPLLWMQHVRSGEIAWPLVNGNRPKPQWLRVCDDSQSLLVPTANYVLLRRFSTKEEARRLVAAPLLAKIFSTPTLGLENHLNYIHRPGSVLTLEETLGLSALYSTALLDRYFRISNGNTQVNATELRALPLPPLIAIQRIGEAIVGDPSAETEPIVYRMLEEAACLSSDFSILDSTHLI